MFSGFKKKDEPIKIEFKLDGEQVSKKDLKTIWKIQNTPEKVSPEEIDILMTHFMIDKDGQFMDEDRAMDLLDKVKGKEIEEVTKRFIDALAENSTPNATRPNSISPSEVGPENLSQSGSGS